MIAALLTAILLAQSAGGVISGLVRDASGNPVTGLRIALMTEPGVLMNIGSTDASGKYRLENIPPGRYYVVAGRVDAPTYYPGTLDLRAARTIDVTVRAALADLNIEMLTQSRPVAAGNLTGMRIRDLALVGNNVLDLINLLPGFTATPPPPTPFTFTFDRLIGTRLFFTSESNLDLQTECVGCSVLVGQNFASVLPGPSTSQASVGPGVEFRVKDGRKELEFICRASRCALGNSSGGKTFNTGETGTIPASGIVLFHVVP